MSQPQPGWYPDPADPARQRYWAGDAWTAETRDIGAPPPAAAPVPPPPPGPADPYASYAAGATDQAVAPAGLPQYRGPATARPNLYPGTGPRTADGVPLAGWWWRVLAACLDSLLLSIVGMVYAPLLLSDISASMTRWYNQIWQMVNSGDFNGTFPSPLDPAYGLATTIAIFSAVSLGVSIVYVFLMLRFIGGTLGQMACGLRVVPVDKGEAHHGLPVSCIIGRVIFYSLLPSGLYMINFLVLGSGNASLAGVGSLCATVGGLYWLINVLWAAWDAKRQCLHDKLARTQVVRIAR